MPDEETPIDGDAGNTHPEDSSNRGINKMLPPQLIKVIENLPEEEQNVVRAMFMAVSVKESFRGPLPHPDILAKYNDALPNGAQLIFSMAKDQAAHRMELEKDTIRDQQKQGRIGQIFGFILGLFGLLIAGLCAYTGHDAVGGIIGTVDLVGLVGIFVLGKYKQTKDLEEKEDP